MLRGAGLLLLLVLAHPAYAQVSGSVSLLSDDLYHGASLSDGGPTAQLALAWDAGDGWYGGAQFTRVRFAYPGASDELQAEPYLGYVHALRGGRSIEAGAQYTWFSHSGRYAFPEFYAGVSSERLRARLAWMPRYFGQADAWYAQLDGNRPLRGPFYAIAHLGALRQAPGGSDYRETAGGRWHYDLAAGAGVTWKAFDLQLTWTTSSRTREATCQPWQCGARSGWVMRLSRSW